MTTLNYSGTLTVVTCWCGMHHAVPEELRDFQVRAHRDGRKQTDINPGVAAFLLARQPRG